MPPASSEALPVAMWRHGHARTPSLYKNTFNIVLLHASKRITTNLYRNPALLKYMFLVEFVLQLNSQGTDWTIHASGQNFLSSWESVCFLQDYTHHWLSVGVTYGHQSGSSGSNGSGTTYITNHFHNKKMQ